LVQLRLEQFEKRLVGRQAKSLAADRRAAVAALLRYEPGDGLSGCPQVLLMRRAERQGDRWSGQVSFPGGKEEQGDSTLRETAIRETHEEVGVSLEACSRFLGPLDPIQAMSAGRVLPTAVWPFVFVQTRPTALELGPEAAHAFWLPLADAAAGRLDSHYLYDPHGAAVELPCWRFQGEVIWGLTFAMLQSLLKLVCGAGNR
jgi:8-oxo-dGTP pyrophosphatase MutT (NUDIX family)